MTAESKVAQLTQQLEQLRAEQVRLDAHIGRNRQEQSSGKSLNSHQDTCCQRLNWRQRLTFWTPVSPKLRWGFVC